MKLFKDLPNTDTPITAENLNQIQDNLVVVSATEPTGDNREKVWIQKGKNLFNKNKNIIKGYRLVGNGNLEVDSNFFYQNEYIKVSSNTNYTISSYELDYFIIEKYNKDKQFLERIYTDLTDNKFTFETFNDTQYLKISCRTPNLDSLQLEQGSTATEYEEYIEPKIYVLNDNGVYEEFISKENLVNYSTGEQRIGTWIDGKPLYRKVVERTNFESGSHEVGWDNANIDKIVKKDFVLSTNGEIISGNINDGTTSVTIKSYKTNSRIDIWLNSSVPCEWLYLTLEYTKTTD